MLILSEKKKIPPWKNFTPASISDEKLLLLTRKIGKAYKVHNFFFVYMIDKIPAIFFNLERCTQPKLTLACYIFLLQKWGDISREGVWTLLEVTSSDIWFIQNLSR